MESFVERLFAEEGMLRMGHGQRREDLNLGLGWIYYALARIQRPRCAVVIGSYRGFAPAVIAKGLLDNAGEAALEFIDPSLVDGFWDDAPSVARHFAALGTPNVRHHRCTTQEFVATEAYARLGGIGLLMIDGYHSAEQARFDYLSFLGKLADGAVTLFHDSVKATSSAIYGEDKRYVHTVRLLMERLRRTPGLETFTLALGDGVTLVRGRPESLEVIQEPF